MAKKSGWTKEERKEICSEFKSLMDLFDRTRAAWVVEFGVADGHSEWFTGQLKARMGN